jgi:hypothetical protein
MPRTLIKPRFKPADYARRIHVATVEPGVTLEDVLEASFWSHVAREMQPFDHVEIIADTCEWWAELLVLDVGQTWAKVTSLRFVELAPAKDAPPSEVSEADEAAYEIRYAGPHALHQVIRKSDRAVLKDSLRSKTDAQTWLREHVKAMKA